jgi:penicillin-binding protein 1A
MGSGTNMALPIWAEFMKRVYADSTLAITQEDEFERPVDFYIDLNCPDIMETTGNRVYDDF